MNSKRTRRIQTVISPEHHDLLLELTRTHGKMNHIIEQGIEQVHQSKTGIHTCDASKTLSIQEQMIELNYGFFDRKFIEDFFNGIQNGNLLDWLEEFQKTNIEAGNPLLTIIDVENTFQGLLEYLQLESDYFKLYNVKFYNENDMTITLQPLLFPVYPELTATILCRTLDFLNFNYIIEIQSNQISIKFSREQSEQSKIARNNDLKKRYETLWSQINPLGYYRYKLSQGKISKSMQEFTHTTIDTIDNLTLYNWEPGKILIQDSRSLLLPQGLFNNILQKPELKESVFEEITKYVQEKINSYQLKTENIQEFLKYLIELWSNMGLGSIQQGIDQRGDEKFLIFYNNVLSGNEIIKILNPVFALINQSLEHGEDEVKNKINLKLTSKSKNILLIDDEPDVIDALKREIKKLFPQANIKTSTSASSVKKQLEKEHYDMIIIDYKMKDMTGIDVLVSIKGDFPNLKKILITGHGDLDIMKEAINRAGVNYFINKPWKKEDLQKAIE
jgi:CheY-like chemotaxis protein